MNSAELTPHTPERFPGLDILRVLAMALITVQHALAAIDHAEWTRFMHISPGQLGVGIFCAVSGLLAMNDRRNPPMWLWRRLQRLFPAYWIAMLFSFAVTALSGRKTFDAYQLISQMLGLGFFTHGWRLVNQVSWFISLILLCYALAFVAKIMSRPGYVIGLFTLVYVMFVLVGASIDLSQHILSFCLAGSAMCLPQRYRRAFLLGSAAILFLFVFKTRHAEFAAASLFLTGLLYAAPWGGMPLIRKAGGSMYEYFLVHGIFFVGAGQFISSPVLVVVCGLAGSIAGAVALRSATEVVFGGWRRAMDGKKLARPGTRDR